MLLVGSHTSSKDSDFPDRTAAKLSARRNGVVAARFWPFSTRQQESSSLSVDLTVMLHSAKGEAMTRSVLAILAGIVTLTAIAFGTEAIADPLLMKLFPRAFPTRSALSHSLPATAFMFTYGAVSVAAGAYVAAWLARRAPLRHAAATGIVQSALTLWAMIAMWNHAPAMNWIVSLAMPLPAALFGGWFFARQASR
jgi:hypothetical protein